MKVITAPTEFERESSELTIFLAGCAGNDWRKEFVKYFEKTPYTFLDPKRDTWGDMSEKEMEEQIAWEIKYCKFNYGMVFMFNDEEAVCPISLLEYGLWGIKDQAFTTVCITPKYPKRFDLITQTKIINPRIKIVDNMDDLVKNTKKMMKAWYK